MRACIEIVNLILIYTTHPLHLSSNVKGLGAWLGYFYTLMKGLFIELELRNICMSAGFAFRAVEIQHCMTLGHCALNYLGYPVGHLRGKIGTGQWVSQRFSNKM